MSTVDHQVNHFLEREYNDHKRTINELHHFEDIMGVERRLNDTTCLSILEKTISRTFLNELEYVVKSKFKSGVQG